MADIVTPAERSRMMSGIRGKDTKPEMRVRSFLHRCGLRFRLHSRDLPGRPDVVLPRYRVAIFVHGCFWHRHPGCRFAYTPKSNVDKWLAKFKENTARDLRKTSELKEAGWRVLIIWECETGKPEMLDALVASIRCGS